MQRLLSRTRRDAVTESEGQTIQRIANGQTIRRLQLTYQRHANVRKGTGLHTGAHHRCVTLCKPQTEIHHEQRSTDSI